MIKFVVVNHFNCTSTLPDDTLLVKRTPFIALVWFDKPERFQGVVDRGFHLDFQLVFGSARGTASCAARFFAGAEPVD